ncbi:phytanoyl-CoA dioxygenase family protein [Micromonospora sp. NPDC049051]|uniref:phytanoyl-CoA dioxygenase family protein n=1 Tax=Micromonospora sp. NPDC049051 TaxID=3364264 RepID=UPI003718CAAE
MARWEEDGYLVLKGVLDRAEVRDLRGRVERAATDYRDGPRVGRAHEGATGNREDLRVKNVVSLSDCLDELLDLDPVYRRAVALAGPYLQVCGTEIILRHPRPTPALAMHLDGGAALSRMMTVPGAPVSHVKALYFLTATPGPGTGNMTVVPGSHRIPLPRTGEGFSTHPARARERELVVDAGDVVLFPWNLWHSVGPNNTTTTRVSAVVWYSQLWARPVDYAQVEAHVLDRMTPRRRLLLGGIADAVPSTYYLPAADDYLPTMLAGLPLDAPELAPYVDDRDSHDWRDGAPA